MKQKNLFILACIVSGLFGALLGLDRYLFVLVLGTIGYFANKYKGKV